MQEEKKPIYTAIAAGALVVIVALALYNAWGNNKQVVNDPGQSTSTPTTAGTLKMEVVTIASTTDLADIRVEYPRFADAPELTKQIERYAEDSIAEFTLNYLANDKARKETTPEGETFVKTQYLLDISWEHAQLNERYVSFIMHLYAFDGGANGRQVPRSFNWDMQSQRDVPLAALFSNDENYLQRISTYTRQVLQGELGDSTSQEFLVDGTQPIAANFQWYTFTDQAVTVYFPKYQVAPGAAGEQQVTIPRDAVGLF